MSDTVIAGENVLLADGATALREGRASDGVRLTLEGLKRPTTVRDAAAAHANLCAGYVLLQQYQDALAHCNTSISLNPSNWRAFNNRAAVFAGQGHFEAALADVMAGLKLAPGSPVLRLSLKIIRERLANEHEANRTANTA